jgi:hypothetical protein
MGSKSDIIDFSFGQMGSAFADASANTVHAPEELAIVAIQFLGETTLSSLVAKDSTNYINTAAASHSTGTYTRTVNQANGSVTKIIFDQENYVSQADQIEVGDEIYDGVTGALHATVAALDPDGDNTKEIQTSGSVTITNNETLVFFKPGKVGHRGAGGMTVDSSQKFPKGATIYGRWDSVSMNADDTDGGIICYFGV